MPCRAASAIPQVLALQGMSPVCVVCALLLSPDLFFLQSSCLQRLSLRVGGSIWSLAGVRHILTRCVLICFQNDTCYLELEGGTAAEVLQGAQA